MDGWKEMTFLPLSAANEIIKNKPLLLMVGQSDDVTSCVNGVRTVIKQPTMGEM